MKKHKVLRITAVILLVLALSAGCFITVSMNRFGIRQVDDYLYTIHTGHVSDGLTRLILSKAAPGGACSAVRSGNITGRNFDWYYDEDAEFIVRTEHSRGRYATLGVASLTGITDDFAKRGRYTPMYHFLSLYLVDGINENGVTVITNEAPSGDTGITTGTCPGGKRLCSMIIPRYVLDHAASTDEAVELLRACDIYSYCEDGIPFDLHFMISDPEKTVVIEFIDNQMVVLPGENIMTNFYLALDEYTEHAMGTERYDILTSHYDEAEDEAGMFSLLERVRYTRYYDRNTDPFWYSESYGEFAAEDGEILGISSDIEKFRDQFEEELCGFPDRKRDGTYWQTVHASVYDMTDLTLQIIAQENGIVHSFSLNRPSTP